MLKKPKSVDECDYFKRDVGIMIWRFEGGEEANIEFKCPKCGFKGEKRAKIVWQNKKINGKKVKVFSFNCDNCDEPINIESNIRRFK
ncbi:MAG: hypothetical protein QXP04_04210 [Candidatus Nanoarchaeia archaeon]|nr:hypothetical protein [Candidatus Jingweiarchaeum tengchongense]